ncbi:MAG: HEAT repeat domain-containing protein [Planctomycetota bacterium]
MRVLCRTLGVIAATIALSATAVSADTVTLINGAAIDGIVTGRHEGFVILTIGNVGTMKIPEIEVQKIEKNPRTGYLDPEKGRKRVKKIPKVETEGGEKPIESDSGEKVERDPSNPDADGLDPAVEKVIRELVKDLTAEKTRKRTRAERRLADFGDAALPELLKIAEHPFVRTRVAVLRLFKRSKDSRVIEPALTALKDDDKFVRKLAWETLKNVSGKSYPFAWDSGSSRKRQTASERWVDWAEEFRAAEEAERAADKKNSPETKTSEKKSRRGAARRVGG